MYVTFYHLTRFYNDCMRVIYKYIEAQRLYNWALQCHYLIAVPSIFLEYFNETWGLRNESLNNNKNNKQINYIAIVVDWFVGFVE